MTGATLVLAAGLAAALLTLAFEDIRFFPPVFAITLIVGGGLGLPLYLLVRSYGEPRWHMPAAAGFFIGALIPALLVLGSVPDQASSGGVPTVVDGSYTWFGWMENLLFVGMFGGAGALAAVFFWRVMRRERGAENEEEPEAPARPAGWKLAALTGGAVAVIAAALVIPTATNDRSCHNSLRDGRDSIGQEAGFNLRAGSPEWRAVAQEVEAFRREGGWSIRSEVRPDESFKWFQISLCKEPGTNISVDGFDDFQQVSFGVYQPQGGHSWRQPFVELHRRIQRRWPGRIYYTGPQGEEIRAPEWVPEDDRLRRMERGTAENK